MKTSTLFNQIINSKFCILCLLCSFNIPILGIGQITGAENPIVGNSSIMNAATITIDGCAGASAMTSDQPFTVRFTADASVVADAGGYDWTITQLGLNPASFPGFLEDASSSIIASGWTVNTGVTSSVDITFLPKSGDAVPVPYQFRLDVEGITINVFVDIDNAHAFCGGAGPSMNLVAAPGWSGQAHPQTTNFNLFNFMATGSTAGYDWELIDDATGIPFANIGQTADLRFNGTPAPFTHSSPAGPSASIDIGGNAPTSDISFTARLRVCDSSDPGNCDELGPITYNISPVAPTRGNVLLVRVCPGGVVPCTRSDVVLFPDPDPKITSVKSWVDEVSYTNDLLTFFEFSDYPNATDAISLDQPLNNYITNNNPLNSIGQEVLDKVLIASPGLIEGTPDIEHIIIYFHDNTTPSQLEYWASPGKLNINSSTEGNKNVGISIVNSNSPWRTIAHSIGHNLGLKDLHYYENATFLGGGALPTPNLSPVGWDHMAVADDGTMSGVHPMVYSKSLTTWLNTPPGNGILYFDGGNDPIPSTTTNVFYQSQRPDVGAAANEINSIVVGLTPSANDFSQEEHYFIIETRSSGLGNLDGTVPDDGALVYYVNNLIPEGGAPVLLYDHTAVTASLNDAAIPVGSTASDINGSGLDVAVGSPLGSGAIPITITYTPPPTDYDAEIPTGNPTWTSENIWVWNQYEGGSITDNYNTPVRGEQNRIYARVYNNGPAIAYNLRVEFQFSAPYNAVEGFTFYDDVLISELRPSDGTTTYPGYTDVFVTWTPPSDIPAHNCVKIIVRDAFNDSNLTNNDAQQNLSVVDTWPNSPFPPREFKFKIKNPDNVERYIYPELDGIPPSWTYSFTPEGTNFNPNQEKEFILTFQPPADYDICTNHPVNIVAWTPHEHTLVKIGGVTVNIQVREDTKLTLDQKLGNCDIDRNLVREHGLPGAETCTCEETLTDVNYTAHEYGQLVNYQFANYVQAPDLPFQRKCKTLYSSGCTNPVRANQKIVLRYRDPAGNPIYKEVMTDSNGCYQDFFVVVEGGDWETTAIYPGTDCAREVETSVKTSIDIPFNGDQDYDGLPDKEEIQGDHNGNGIPNHLDPDSDSDGIKDGKEIKGNCDNDSYENVVDPDSDNDGILDGQDKNPCEKDKIDQDNIDDDDDGKGGIILPFGFGITTPLKTFDNVYDPGLLIELKALFPLTTFNPNNTGNLALSLNLEAGIYTFDDSRNTDQPLNIWGIAGGPRLDYHPSGKDNLNGFTFYVDLNGGGYNPSTNPFESGWTFGWNYGAGVGYKFNRFVVDLGYSRFYVGDSIDFSGLGLAIGVSF